MSLNNLSAEQIETLKRVKDSPGEFARAMFQNPLKPSEPFEPTWYQEEFFNCKKRYILVNAGRQVGKSEMIVKYSVHRAYTQPRSKILIISRSQRQAGFILQKIRADIEGSDILSKSITRASRTEVHLDNGSFIVSLPPSRQTILGYSADIVFIDEAAHFTDDSVFYEAIFPMIIRTRGRIVMTSTPYGKSGFYYDNYLDWSNNEHGQVFNFPAIYKGEPLAPGVTMSDLDYQKRMMGELSFRIEYLAEFVDDGVLYFPTSLVKNCVEDYDFVSAGNPMYTYYMGIDWGKKRSSTVITILHYNKLGQHKVVHIKEFKGTAYDKIVNHIAYLAERFNIKKCLADTGAGLAQIDQLKAMGMRIEGFNFTQQSKIELFSNLRLLMEHGDIVLPNLDKLKIQLTSFKQELSPTGKVLLHAEEGGYDDYVDSLALAAYLVKRIKGVHYIKKVPKKRGTSLTFY